MITSQELFAELREGDEYLSLMCKKEVYSGIELELRERIVVNDIRQKNSKFKEDEVHQELVKNMSKAKKELIKYEFNQNHK
jgi:hypothetical protein